MKKKGRKKVKKWMNGCEEEEEEEEEESDYVYVVVLSV